MNKEMKEVQTLAKVNICLTVLLNAFHNISILSVDPIGQ